MANTYHVPVMAFEVLERLDPQPGQTFVDATLGGGGHAKLIAERLGPTGHLIGIDQDADAISAAQEFLANSSRQSLVQARFDRLGEVLQDIGVLSVDGILFDLGVSSHQLDAPERGFSFKDPAMPLDMRMRSDIASDTASVIVNSLPKEDLTRIFRDYADEIWAARIAEFIVERRKASPFTLVGDLVETVKAAVPVAARSKDIHPATKVFQALRIAVNDEFNVLSAALSQAVQVLHKHQRARIAVISYHSGEDRIVKRFFAKQSGHCECPPMQPVCTCGAANPELSILTKRPLTPTPDEVMRNPRARSAKMRVAQRL